MAALASRAVWKSLLGQRWPWIVSAAFLGAVLLSTFVVPDRPQRWDRRPRGTIEDIAELQRRGDANVLFLLIDTLRADHLGSYGYGRDTSPTLDHLARTGVRFSRHLAQSTWTKSSMASLWTSLYPNRTGITRYDHVVPDDALMPAEILRDAGIRSIGLYRNGWVAPTFGFDQGFEVYKHPAARPLPPGARRNNPTLTHESSDLGQFEGALEFLRVDGRGRWMIYLHLMDLHEYIYGEESALFGSTYKDIYDNSIRWNDDSIRIFLEELSAMGFLENTIIVLASDHGEAFLERGFEGHARRVYRETTEVPFLISFPFRLDPGIVVESRTQNVDVWPTLLDLLGIEPPGDIDGRSRLPEILSEPSAREADEEVELAVSHLDQTWAGRSSEPLPTIAVSEGPYRYVRVDMEDEPATEELFDARDDPLERRNRTKEAGEQLERLRAAAEEYEALEPSWGEAPTRELELKLLRALGYVIK